MASVGPAPQIAAEAETPPSGLGDILLAGGITGVGILLVLALLSIFAMAVAVEHLVTLREATCMPPELSSRIRQLLSEGQTAAADQACRSHASPLAEVVRAALAEIPSGWRAMEKAAEDALADQSARLFRKIDYLSVIGNIAPMLGLLGTVFGMIFAFREVADTQGAARAADLAGGIYQALVTTVAGLLVAIPSFAAFAVFRNRIDRLMSDVGQQAAMALEPAKRSLLARSAASFAASGSGVASPPRRSAP